MKLKANLVLLALITICTIACKKETKEEPVAEPVTESAETRTTIEMETSYGTIVFELYNETPKHRDNFVKIVNDGVLDSVLFHRVINQFMIQTGDTSSKNAQAEDTLGSSDLPYMVDAEFNPKLFHKRGAIGAARGDNPERASSSTQFYIVQRGPRNDSLIDVDQGRINGWLAEHYMRKDSTYNSLFEARNQAVTNEDMETYRLYQDSIKAISETYTNYKKHSIPESQREVYRTLGGTPHLDQNYTVFGEVILGMEVVDSIAITHTNDLDRPTNDIRILSIKIKE